jgi:hypothetical protein
MLSGIDTSKFKRLEDSHTLDVIINNKIKVYDRESNDYKVKYQTASTVYLIRNADGYKKIISIYTLPIYGIYYNSEDLENAFGFKKNNFNDLEYQSETNKDIDIYDVNNNKLEIKTNNDIIIINDLEIPLLFIRKIDDFLYNNNINYIKNEEELKFSIEVISIGKLKLDMTNYKNLLKLLKLSKTTTIKNATENIKATVTY